MKFNILRKLLVIYTFIHVASISAEEISLTYSNKSKYVMNVENGSLLIHSNNKKVIYENFFYSHMLSNTSLEEFNKKPALVYESNSTWNSQNYFTLIANGKNNYIDCIYMDARVDMSGLTFRGNICGLQGEIEKDFNEMTFIMREKYNKIGELNISKLLNNSASINILVENIGDIEVYQLYENIDDIINQTPKTIVKNGLSTHLFDNKVFIEYNKTSLKAISINVLLDNETLKKYNYQLLTTLLQPLK